IACLRLSSKAQWEIREVVKMMIEEAKKVVPEVVDLLKRLCSDSIEV
ncbi:MAG: FAD-dependent thymidylate synthase, partial [Crenarchaeota archaeon]|nr:FAD-dependent thymidylate synthase [Thermoproteota archaeon]